MRVLVVDDEPDTVEALTLLLRPLGFDVRAAASAAGARKLVAAWRPSVVLLDLMLPDVQGLDLLRELRRSAPDAQVVMVTGHGSIPRVVDAMNAGAYGYIQKPIEAPLLLAVLEKVRAQVDLASENRRLKRELDAHASLADMVTRSTAMRDLFSMVRTVAPSDANVLILGEHGTGKELVANAIHAHSRRAGEPFVKINCAAIPAELMESQLFGHRRGSFTGALADTSGVLEQSNGGTLLLDEIGEMPAALQTKLLRVLQEREYTPVGSAHAVKSDFRLICATNVDLDAALASGRLRQDLYFRVNTFTLTIPPLRRRPQDIELLAYAFLSKYAARHERKVERIDAEAVKALLRHSWPGNVRELEHAIERAVIVADGPVIQADDLPAGVLHVASAHDPLEALPGDVTLEEVERLAILRTLERTQWNKRAAAAILGLYRPTLYSKLRKYNLMNRPAAAGALSH